MKLLMVLLLVTLTACAHQHKESKHHHEQKPDSLVNLEHETYKFEHGGRTYYFDTEKKKQEFIENLKKDLNSSNCFRKGRSRVCSDK